MEDAARAQLGLLAEQHTRAVMAAGGEASRRLVELDAHVKHVSLAGLTNAQLERIKVAALLGRALRSHHQRSDMPGIRIRLRDSERELE